MAVAQGGWKSTSNERYERFETSEVLALPNRMLAARPGEAEMTAAAALPRPPIPPVPVARVAPPSLSGCAGGGPYETATDDSARGYSCAGEPSYGRAYSYYPSADPCQLRWQACPVSCAHVPCGRRGRDQNTVVRVGKRSWTRSMTPARWCLLGSLPPMPAQLELESGNQCGWHWTTFEQFDFHFVLFPPPPPPFACGSAAARGAFVPVWDAFVSLSTSWA